MAADAHNRTLTRGDGATDGAQCQTLGMVMGRRPDVKTAPPAVAAVDTVMLGGQMAAALFRVPFRNPFRGDSNMASNLGSSVTREVLRTFMGYCSSLPIDEFRSIEMLLDDLCRVV